ncbi:MAG: hypothetical protein ACLFUS_03645 [Candidatus Sumerlaeia bacterium]
MDDTDPVIREKMIELFREMSPDERLERGCAMFDFSVELLEAALQQNGPLPPLELKKQVFKRMYADDFDDETMEKIMAAFDDKG